MKILFLTIFPELVYLEKRKIFVILEDFFSKKFFILRKQIFFKDEIKVGQKMLVKIFIQKLLKIELKNYSIIIIIKKEKVEKIWQKKSIKYLKNIFYLSIKIDLNQNC